ncbi:alpha/beta fold hydrolase [Sporobolomyces salmoneus]|uniref:alpha/beta fold hydrolase n=1 Tax=Sporobolomyces salmoneus TaxID=183962 RepID=UPI00316FB43C
MSAIEALELEGKQLPNSIFSPDYLVKRGWCTVAQGRRGIKEPHEIYYELHGEDKPDSTKLLFIMGLNNSSFAWHNQLSYFSSLPGYSVLVFDNKGVGHSDSPKGRYQTSQLARDVQELLEHVGWLEGEDKVNVVGVSMGGMIALELALLIPRHINTLLLTSTKAGSSILPEIPSWAATRMFGLLTSGMIKTPQAQIELVVETLFPKEYLDAAVEGAGVKTRREVVEADFLHRYNVGKRQPLSGRLGQLSAVLSHRVSTQRLNELSKSLPATSRIAIIHGDQDNLINVSRGKELHRDLPGSTLKIVEGGGHALPSQITKEYNEWIKNNIEKTV